MNKINLYNLELKIFAEQDAFDYCEINNINPDDITYLDLSDNKLTNISGIKIFKNLEELELYSNQIKDISVLKDLNKLKILDINDNKIKDISALKNLNKLKLLDIENLELESDQIEYINSIKNLKELWCENGFKDMSVLNKLNNNIETIK